MQELPSLGLDLLGSVALLCDAASRAALASTCRALRARCTGWRDVKHLYVCRSEAQEEQHCTLVPHSFAAAADVRALGSFRFFHWHFLRLHCPHISTLILESSQLPFMGALNRLTEPEPDFLDSFPCLETVKFCNVMENMGWVGCGPGSGQPLLLPRRPAAPAAAGRGARARAAAAHGPEEHSRAYPRPARVRQAAGFGRVRPPLPGRRAHRAQLRVRRLGPVHPTAR